ncbi:hypothetical protein [Streptomyces canarius]|uniref:Uncharacterized protein n=1 Tax=Streptomyces canarius TaxID=285453 RepID=A0ABQ3DEB6_9ACTN|nr:hypothetical protein GCM10010345_91770 [Streptomyces canarius]
MVQSRLPGASRSPGADGEGCAGYAKAFASLAETAVYGDAARALIRAAIDALE